MKTKAIRSALAQATGVSERQVRDRVQQAILASGLTEREVLDGMAERAGLRLSGKAAER